MLILCSVDWSVKCAGKYQTYSEPLSPNAIDRLFNHSDWLMFDICTTSCNLADEEQATRIPLHLDAFVIAWSSPPTKSTILTADIEIALNGYSKLFGDQSVQPLLWLASLTTMNCFQFASLLAQQVVELALSLVWLLIRVVWTAFIALVVVVTLVESQELTFLVDTL